MPAAFADHFSRHAGAYARYRPTYPDALFAWLATRTRRHDLVWDAGTGNGQAALGLAAHYARVVATDPSAEQIARAGAHARVTYRVGREGESGLAPGSADLVTAAQAFHWFDAPAFWAEARRALAPGGAIAIWCYGRCTIAPAIDPLVHHFYHEVVGPDWPAGRELVDALYAPVVLPFPEVAAPAFAIEQPLTLQGFVRYVETWSAVRRHRARTGDDPLPDFHARLAGAWGDPASARLVRWPIGLRVTSRP